MDDEDFDYFKGFKKIKVDDLEQREKKKHPKDYRPYTFNKGNGKLAFCRNYKERHMNDQFKGLHKKLLKYPVTLDKRMKKFYKTKKCKELGISSLNDMFIFATEKLLNEYE